MRCQRSPTGGMPFKGSVGFIRAAQGTEYLHRPVPHMLRSLQTCLSLADNAIATERLDQTNQVHISSFGVGENTELVPTGGMPLERSVGKATRHAFATVTMPVPTIRCQTCRAKQAGLTVRLLRSEQRSDTRLSNALADHSYRTKRTAVPHRLGPLSTCQHAKWDCQHCYSKHALPNKPG